MGSECRDRYSVSGGYSNVKITGGEVQDLDYGVYFDVPTGDSTNHTSIEHTTFSGNYCGFYGNNFGYVGDVSFLNDTFESNEYDINWYNFGSAHVMNFSNNYHNYGRYGVSFYNSGNLANVDFRNNTCNMTGPCVYTGNYADLQSFWVGGNDIYDCYYPYPSPPLIPYAAISFYGGGSDITVSNNKIGDCTNMAGIRFVGGYDGSYPFYGVNIHDNWIENMGNTFGSGYAPGAFFYNIGTDSTGMSGMAALAGAGRVTPTIQFNSFISNTGPGISYTMGITNPLPYIDARHNWWGDPAGPNGPNGDGVSANVLYDPWLTGSPTKTHLPLILKNF